jgi:ABC-2 type transport system ATP-binding protein
VGNNRPALDDVHGEGALSDIQENGGFSMELCIDRLTKQYENKIAVDRISLQLTNGIYGLLGANGAGKTTLMRMICGILKPTGGTITFDGIDVSDEAYRAILGYLPQDFGYYPDFSAMDFLLYMASLKGLSKHEAKLKSKELLEMVGLSGNAKQKIKTFSGGMKQRLGIAQALLNDPKILILDEPTAGLDPKERVRFRNLIKDLGKNSIVLLSTHIVSDIEHIADRVIMIRDGQLIYNENAADIADLEALYLEKFGE